MSYTKCTLLLGAACFAAAAHADIIIIAAPGNFPNDENLLFNQPGLIASGPLVNGLTNQTHFSVDFFDAGEDLITPPGGQARVAAVDGDFTDVSLRLTDPLMGFGTLVWNLNAVSDGSVTFTIKHTAGADVVATYDIGSSGQNWFRFQAVNNDAMTLAKIHTTVQLQDVRQTRIGEMAAVPEPASFVFLGAGLAVLFARYRKSR